MLVNQRVTGGENTIYQHLLHLPASEEMGIQRDLLFRKKEVATAPGRSDFFSSQMCHRCHHGVTIVPCQGG